MTKRVDTDLATSTACEQMVPPWIQRMRDVAAKHLTVDVIDSIVKSQIEMAKKGDKNAIKFVFDQLMGGQAVKGATFVQNNYGAEFGEAAAKPALARPGSTDKLTIMQRRAANGQSLTQPGDVAEPGWECAGCGHTFVVQPDRCPKCGVSKFVDMGQPD